MPDVFAVCDRIAVLRRGRKVAEKAIAETSPEEVTGLITGAILAVRRGMPRAASRSRTSRASGSAPWSRPLANQAFWVSVAVALICLATAWEQPDTFATKANFFNVTRNFAAIGIMAMGMTAVIITGGIDLSVGSVMAFVAIVAARLLEAEYPWFAACRRPGAGALVGAVNGSLIAYVKLPPFVVTLGMLSIARSLAIVVSENRVIYQFGPGGDVFKAIGGGQIELPWIDGGTLQLSNLFVVLVVLAICTASCSGPPGGATSSRSAATRTPRA